MMVERPTRSLLFSCADQAGVEVRLELERYDVGYDDTLADAVIDGLHADVSAHWWPLLARAELAGRDPDRDWAWRETVYPPTFTHLRTGDPMDGTLLVVRSERQAQPEAIASVIYGWETVLLPLLPPRRGAIRGTAPRAAYIDTVATSPWNRTDCPPPTRIRHLGKRLLIAGILLSLERGHSGAIALHSALTAKTWYQNVLVGCRSSYVGKELGENQEPLDPERDGPYVEVDGPSANSYCKLEFEIVTEIGSIVTPAVLRGLAAG